MVVGSIVHYIIANISVPEKNSTPTHTSAYNQTKTIKYPMFQNQIIDTYNVTTAIIV